MCQTKLKTCFACIFAFELIASGCSSKSTQTAGHDSDSIVTPVESSTIEDDHKTEEEKPKYTATQAYGLMGPVKMVKDESQKLTTVFNKIGNVESEISKSGYKDSNETYIYSDPDHFKISGFAYTISIKDNKMTITADDGDETLTKEYEFDTLGRVRRYSHSDGYMPINLHYSYKGNDMLPWKMEYSEYDETGTYTTVFEYTYDKKDIDSHGNWTKRKVKATHTSEEYEQVMNEDGEYEDASVIHKNTEDLVETRSISYY